MAQLRGENCCIRRAWGGGRPTWMASSLWADFPMEVERPARSRRLCSTDRMVLAHPSANLGALPCWSGQTALPGRATAQPPGGGRPCQSILNRKPHLSRFGAMRPPSRLTSPSALAREIPSPSSSGAKDRSGVPLGFLCIPSGGARDAGSAGIGAGPTSTGGASRGRLGTAAWGHWLDCATSEIAHPPLKGIEPSRLAGWLGETGPPSTLRSQAGWIPLRWSATRGGEGPADSGLSAGGTSRSLYPVTASGGPLICAGDKIADTAAGGERGERPPSLS